MDFGALNQPTNSLQSEILRQAIGERNIDVFSRYQTNNQGLARKQVLANVGRGLLGNLLDWAIKNIGSYILQSAMTLYTMNWNATDQEIEQQIKANETVIASQLGQLSANTLVYTVGIGMFVKASTKYPVMAGKTALLVAEEGGEEIQASIRSFLLGSRNAIMRSTILTTYLTGRRLLIGAQTQKKDPWSASDALDKLIENNRDANVRAYWNAFKDQTEDAILDFGYIVNYGFLEAYELMKAQRKAVLGKNRIVELTPDITKENETVYVYGRTQQIIPQISGLIASSRMIDNKDIGEFVGMPIKDLHIADDQTRILKIYYRNTPNGASKLVKDGRTVRATKVEMKIGNIKPSLTWNEVKSAVENYQRGNIIVTAILSNKRQVQIYCANAADGKSIIRKMVALTDLEIIKFSESEQDPTNIASKKEVEMMYPAIAHFEVRRPTAVESEIKFRDLKGQGYRIEKTKARFAAPENQNGWVVIP